MRPKIINKSFFFLRQSLFILFACLCTIQAAPLYAGPKEHYQNRNQADAALIVSVSQSGKLVFHVSGVPHQKTSTASRSFSDRSLTRYYALCRYNQTVLACLKRLCDVPALRAKWIAGVRQKNICPRSSEEDPLS